MKKFSPSPLLYILTLVVLLPSCKKDELDAEPEPSNTITVGVAGGGFDLKNGLHLDVPPGAVDGDRDIGIELVEYSRYSSQQANPIAEENLLLAFEGTPDGMAFNKPITVIASGIEIPAGKIAILRELSSTVHPLPDATLEYDAESKELKISLDHFSAKSSEAMDQYAAEECAKAPCRCKKFHVNQYDGDNICDNGSCQVLESVVEVSYPECSDIPEVSIFREVTPGCQASISVEAASKKIPLGGSTEITATTELGCVIIENQSVDFVPDALGTVNPANATSDSEGKARTTFLAGETKGISTITANSTISYYSTYIEANGEVFKGDLKTNVVSNSIQVEIKDTVEVWEGEFRAVLNYSSGDFQIKDYHVEADFLISLGPSDRNRKINQIPGIIEIRQSLSMEYADPDVDIRNIIPLIGKFESYFFRIDTVSNEMLLIIYPWLEVKTPFLTFEMWMDQGEGFTLFQNIEYPPITSYEEDLFFHVPVDQDSFHGQGQCGYDPEGLNGTYTLDFQKLE